MESSETGTGNPAIIRTPDQRLRVFVSSTLQELAEERRAVQGAVTDLQLTPVLFEMGARPYPPRDLYRAYLAQSHVFVGIYWERYGWVSPEMEISGLEDEYRLAVNLPRLIYIKSPAPKREPQLQELLNRIKRDDRVSYKYFATAEELRKLVQNDLALLLTERFEQTQPGIALRVSATPARSNNYTNLPQPLTSVIGRDTEIQAVSDMLSQSHLRLVTLIGPGGVGKTRLSLAVAEALIDNFNDGIYWIPLGAIEAPELVISAIAQVLDVRERSGSSLLASLKAYLQDRQLLLLLDNFEQVIAAGPVVAGLLEAAPDLKILVTSRAPLRLRGEREFPVLPLPLPDPASYSSPEQLGSNAAVRLFVERAQEVNPAFLLADETDAVAEVVRRLDGLPLAIELAAARIKLLSPGAILNRLQSRLKLLTGGAQDLPARQQTIRNTIDWSYGLLDRETQALFSQLSVFAGTFSMEAVEAVCESIRDVDIFEGISSLVNNSLLNREPELANQPRFSMLETIREYALERLAEKGEETALRQRHATYFAQLSTRAARRFFSGESERWLDQLAADYNNLRAALIWLQGRLESLPLSWQMIINLEWLWYRRGYLNEARQWYEKAAEQAAHLEGDALQANILQSAGAIAMWRSELMSATRLMDEGLQILRVCGETVDLAVALFRRGVLATNQQDAETAKLLLLEALPLFQHTGQEWFQAMIQLHLGNVALSQGDIATANAHMAEALTLGRRVGDRWVIASTTNNFGEIARYQGDHDEAGRHYVESRALFQSVASWPDVARADHSLGYIAFSQGNFNQAEDLFKSSLALHEKLGIKRGVIECLLGLAVVIGARGQVEQAAQLFAAAQAQLAALGTGMWPADEVSIRESRRRVRRQLGEVAYKAAEKNGQVMALNEAIALVRG